MKLAPLITTLLLCGSANLFAQANLTIAPARDTNNAINVRWEVRSLVPPPGVPIFASYKVMVSSNLADWQQVGDVVRGNSSNQTVLRVIAAPEAAARFSKVESILNFGGLNLIALPLENGNFERARFTGCDFFGSSLDGANLRNALVEAADLRGASLINADLRGANFMASIFFQANLEGVNARNANLSFVDFNEANLDGADLKDADLRFSSLLAARSDFIRLHRARIDEHTRLNDKTRLVWEIVNGKMTGLTLTNRDLTLCDLSEADLQNAVWRAVDVRGSSFERTDLRGANLLQANLDFVDWRGAILATNTSLPTKARLVWQITNEDFSERDINGRDVSNSAFVRVRLHKAILTRANFTRSILIDSDLTEADLRSVNFTDADLTGSDFTGANLTAANLRNADLTDAILLNANLASTTQIGTIFRNTTMPDGTIRNPN